MHNLSLKQKLIAAAIIIGSALILIFTQGLHPTEETPRIEEPTSNNSSTEANVVSTNPSPLDNTTILPTQSIEITVDTPLQNEPETKINIHPEIEYKLELTNNRKTIKITPNDTWGLGTGYSLSIKTETKFEQGKKLNEEKIYHFMTINYRGV